MSTSGNGAPASSHVSVHEALDVELAGALEAYLAAVESGRPVDLDRLAARHPAIADQLRACLGVLRLAREVEGSAEAGADAPSEPREAPAPVELGDFRLIRPVGRGGMGVVYEAEQVSLRRRVALKVLPFAAALDQVQLRRFQTEAQAAAQLHHTNIVPVFAVGCERGVHYYAMQFIEGQTLATLIRDLRQSDLPDESAATEPRAHPPTVASRLLSGELAPAEPVPSPRRGEGGPQGRMRGRPARVAAKSAKDSSPSIRTRAYFRTVANLGLQAAEALDHAHALGIIHRDVKPANLLIDVRGNLWITDFGLARMQADAALTVTGDVLGTLRYMSPEQALARRGVVDHRTDIYSLGATLYELLTLRPVFPGQDRQALLRQIAEEEPISPRRLNPAIPRELETIILKAMAKETEGRYGSAQEFADDLRRFLENKPIRARRPTLPERVVKWWRRHPSVAFSILIVGFLAILFLAVGFVIVSRERDHAIAEQLRAQAHFRQAREAVDQMLTEVSEKTLGLSPHMERVRRALLEKALRLYQGFVVQAGSDPTLRLEAARAYRRLGDIRGALDEYDKADQECQKGLELLEGLAASNPPSPDVFRELAVMNSLRSGLLFKLGKAEEAQQRTNRAIQYRKDVLELASSDPEDRLALAMEQGRLGSMMMSLGRLDEAKQLLNLARESAGKIIADVPSNPKHHTSYGALLNDLGVAYMDMNEWPKARDLLQEAMNHAEEAVRSEPDNPGYQVCVRNHEEMLAVCLRMLGQKREAEAKLRHCADIGEKLVANYPSLPMYRSDLGGTYGNLSEVLLEMGPERRDAAVDAMRRADRLFQSLVTEKPNVLRYRWELAQTRGRLGQLSQERGHWKDAEHSQREAVEHCEALVAGNPASRTFKQGLADHKQNLASLLALHPETPIHDPARAIKLAKEALELNPKSADSWLVLGVAQYRGGDWKAAVDALEKSSQLRPAGDVEPVGCFVLAMAHWRLGHKEEARTWFDKAVTWTEKHKPKDGELARYRAEAAQLMGPATPRH